MSVLVAVPYYFYYYGSVIEVEIWGGDTSSNSFIIQDVLALLSFYRELLALVKVNRQQT